MNEAAYKAFLNFKPRPVDAWMFENPAVKAHLELQIIACPSYVLPSAEEPAAICGIVNVLGIGSVWLVTGEGFERKAPIVIKQLHVLCQQAYEVLNLHRLQMWVNSDDEKAKRFAQRLGFVCEAERLKAMGARGQDMDVYLMERTIQWAE